MSFMQIRKIRVSNQSILADEKKEGVIYLKKHGFTPSIMPVSTKPGFSWGAVWYEGLKHE